MMSKKFPSSGGELKTENHLKMIKSLRQKALDFLAIREHSCFELAQKLKGYQQSTPAEIADLLNTLETQKLLSDVRFAESYCGMRFKKGYGSLRISQELKVRGVPEEIISEILEKISAEEWKERAEAVRQKKFGKAIPTDVKEKLKQNQFLYYRGFTST